MGQVEHELRVYGHRGAAAHRPENTLEAFERALEDGATALEMDVHRSADGHIVVAHDPDGRRTALREENIRDLTLEQLSSWNVAAGFPGLSSDHLGVPTLTEVLDRYREVPFSIDLKPDDMGMVPTLLEVVRTRDAESRVTVGSFHSPMVRRLRRLGYRGPTALTRPEVALLRFLPALLVQRFIGGDAAMIPTSSGSLRLDRRSFIRRCRRLGLRVDYWVVNDPNEARTLLDRGATGIVTDDPGRIAPVMAAQGQST